MLKPGNERKECGFMTGNDATQVLRVVGRGADASQMACSPQERAPLLASRQPSELGGVSFPAFVVNLPQLGVHLELAVVV